MQRLTTTVISHFYNEEYLLPWWLDHHRQLFDHGVLIDYGSTDSSVAICRELVPDWEIVRSRNATFRAVECDLEVMDIERGLSGWKIALNTTEFFCCRDMSSFLSSLMANHAKGAFVRGAVMADRPEHVDVPAIPGVSLVSQRHEGYFEDEYSSKARRLERSRLIHRRRHGAYTAGRHSSFRRGNSSSPPGALILWFGFSPWTPEMRARKLQIQSRVPATDRAVGLGSQHVVTEELLKEKWAQAAARAYDLRRSSDYTEVAGGLHGAENRSRPARQGTESRVPPTHTLRLRQRPRRRWLPTALSRGFSVEHLRNAYAAANVGRSQRARAEALLALSGGSSIRLRALLIIISPNGALRIRRHVEESRGRSRDHSPRAAHLIVSDQAPAATCEQVKPAGRDSSEAGSQRQ
jgi:hypothetical protein